MLKSLALLAGVASTGLAVVVKHDWDITWVDAAPDGFHRPVIGINGVWPCPPIEATVGDRIVITITNKLVNESTGLHFHGMHQIGTPHMDGPAHATQCGVPPGKSFTYDFTADQSGTYWYHSHTGSQYPDGLRAPLIIKDKVDPYAGKYDEEYTLSLSDWYRTEVPTLINQMLSPNNTQIRPPIPNAVLVNDIKGNTTLKFVPGKKYKIRVINMSALAGVILFLDQHKLKVIEVDGEYVEAAETDQIYVAAAQRYAFIVEAKADAEQNYGFLAVFDINPDFRLPTAVFPFNSTGTLQYDASKPVPAAPVIKTIDFLDDFTLKPLDSGLVFTGPKLNTITLNFNLGFDAEGIPRAFFDNHTYVHQKVPSLYTAISVGADAVNPIVYGEVNPHIIQTGETVELVVNNHHFAHHPFHLHGHHFQVVSRGSTGSGVFAGSAADYPLTPMRRDTVVINGNSFAVLRFKADNPGVWLFHCHLEWHVTMGLTATFIESPLELQKKVKIPQQHLDACECGPTEGNAAGNKVNPLDLTGAKTKPDVPENGAIYTPSTCPTTTSSTIGPTTTPSPTGTATGTATTTETDATTVTTCPVETTTCLPGKKCGSFPPANPPVTGTCDGTVAVVTETATIYVASYSGTVTSTITACATGAW